MQKTVMLLVIALLGAGAARAAQWSTTSVSLLHGSGYELASSTDATILTLDHASGWKFGDNFFFFDAFQPFQNDTHIYGEWHPRLSFGKMTKRHAGFGFVKDVLIATELNVGEKWRAYLYGLGFDLEIPHFRFFALNVFIRDDMTIAGDSTFQISPSWNLPFSLGGVRCEFCGFLDYAGAEGGGQASVLAQPQLLLDIGNFSQKPGNILVGVEYQYWHNKYGVDGVEESVVQFMGKWVF